MVMAVYDWPTFSLCFVDWISYGVTYLPVSQERGGGGGGRSVITCYIPYCDDTSAFHWARSSSRWIFVAEEEDAAAAKEWSLSEKTEKLKVDIDTVWLMVNDFHYSNCDLHKRSFIVFTRLAVKWQSWQVSKKKIPEKSKKMIILIIPTEASLQQSVVLLLPPPTLLLRLIEWVDDE